MADTPIVSEPAFADTYRRGSAGKLFSYTRSIQIYHGWVKPSTNTDGYSSRTSTPSRPHIHRQEGTGYSDSESKRVANDTTTSERQTKREDG